jgi:hypothetical protein
MQTSLTPEKLIMLGATAQTVFSMRPGFTVQFFKPGEVDTSRQVKIAGPLPEIPPAREPSPYFPAPERDLVQLKPFADKTYADHERLTTLVWAGYSAKLNILCVQLL